MAKDFWDRLIEKREKEFRAETPEVQKRILAMNKEFEEKRKKEEAEYNRKMKLFLSKLSKEELELRTFILDRFRRLPQDNLLDMVEYPSSKGEIEYERKRQVVARAVMNEILKKIKNNLKLAEKVLTPENSRI